jgi:hypothetical protein
MRLLLLVGLGLLGACSSNSGGDSGVCHAGCLCFSSAEACPPGCYPGNIPSADGGSQFVCGNAPPPDAAAE